MCQLKGLKSQYSVSFSINNLLFVYNFAVISTGTPNITVNYYDCHLPEEIVEVSLFGNKVALFRQFSCYPQTFRK